MFDKLTYRSTFQAKINFVKFCPLSCCTERMGLAVRQAHRYLAPTLLETPAVERVPRQGRRLD